MAEVLVTGGDTEFGRTIAAGFLDAGHNVVIAGARREDLELAAKQLDVESIVFDNTDPSSLENARALFPHHLDTLVNVPAPLFEAKDPRAFTLTDLATAWRNALEATVVSAVLTVQIVGDHLRSGGSIINVVPASPREGSAEAAVKAALGDWTAGQATYFGTRGITVNVIAPGLSADPGYDGLGSTPPSVADEFARMAVFLSTPAARHITGQTLHVSRGALATLG
ncbi:SDR family oxidoreductase [Mycolicibacterium nivoides]|uniref:SDR family oxidoreductase n=1 Tax=Mycolicibacterium nivoides TaxID=2487344 RepID=A0ABW9LB72_9MYCO|nr:SDR family oxidoreductase [Mycolicibacterium nivoides]QRY44416.1 SDR family oxidoreductase [Mycolicibacterium boenickei]SER67394.1 NAD(P)-dependent dehydrogenase, short-chain alcohol dehydrogenase family [Mycobacterium sp. 88mf]SFG41005.1 NAD(P)-dependent dehydrogenase, short-chain alcohol dehydrogenase family [Mycobacterium sp. 455mf]